MLGKIKLNISRKNKLSLRITVCLVSMINCTISGSYQGIINPGEIISSKITRGTTK